MGETVLPYLGCTWDITAIFPSSHPDSIVVPILLFKKSNGSIPTIFWWPTLLSLIHVPLSMIILLISTCRMVAFSCTKVFPHWGLLDQVLMHPIHVVSNIHSFSSLYAGRGCWSSECPVSEPQSSGESSPVLMFIGKPRMMHTLSTAKYSYIFLSIQ